jgi:hypothetical protein
VSFDLVDIRGAWELPGTGLNIYPTLDGANSLPCGVLGNVEEIGYVKSLGGMAVVEIPFWVLVSRADDHAAQRALDRATSIAGEGSVYAAIRTLAVAEGKPWRSIEITGTGPYGTTEVGTAKAMAVAFNLIITA